MITSIRIISVPVKDQEKAKTFYTNVLGLDCITDATWGEGMRWVEVAPKGSSTRFALVTWFPNMQPGGLAGIVLDSSDIDADYKTLKSKGVQFMGEIQQDPNGRFAMFQDVDGNALMLRQA
jgi:predicted enzyme related to lactoylglutathione lyase